MERETLEEACKQAKIIDVCECILDDTEGDVEDAFAGMVRAKDPFGHILELLNTDKQIRLSFLQWVANQKKIAEKKFNEI